MKKVKLAALLMLILIPLWGKAPSNLNVADFGVNPGLEDATPGLIKALEASRQLEDCELIFPKGEYHFYPYFGVDKYCFISNNTEGLKRIIFPLFDFKNLTIDGQGSSFIFHGFVNPFVIDHSSSVTLKNFSVDVFRTFHSEAIIIANREDGVDLEIPENFPFEIKDGLLIFTDYPNEEKHRKTGSKDAEYEYHRSLEFDTEKRETAFMVGDQYLGEQPIAAESLGSRQVRVYEKDLQGTVGNTIVFGPATRKYPGFVVSDCSDITFHGISIHHSGGMGIIGQRTHNITVDHCKVTPSSGRILSCDADATHFVNCTGKIELSHCLFENQMDDATNIHGIYVQIVEILSSNEVIVQLKHMRHAGFDFLKGGITVEFVKGRSLITKGSSEVLETERLNKEFTRIKFSSELPSEILVGDAIAELRDYPFVHIHDNIIRNNRARGMLLNCRGKTIVENNYFHSPGTALLFQGDANHCFEQGGVNNCKIRNNVFDNCKFGVWGNAVIGVGAGIYEDFEASRYNKNIKITGNTFRTFDDVLLLDLYCVDGLTWKDNKVERTKAYPAAHDNSDLFRMKHCNNITILEE